MIEPALPAASPLAAGSLLTDVAGSLWQHRQTVAALIFFGFFAAAGVLLGVRADGRLRTVFVGFLLLGLAVPGVTGLEPYPFVDMREFTTPASGTETTYEFRVVDERGEELPYDTRAAPPMIDATLRKQGERMDEVYDASTCRAVAAHLLEEAREYRSTVEDRGPVSVESIEFPHHKIAFRWTPAELDAYGRFVGLRVYRLTLSTSEDGRAVESRTETAIVDFRAAPGGDENVIEGGSGNATPSEFENAAGCSNAGASA